MVPKPVKLLSTHAEEEDETTEKEAAVVPEQPKEIVPLRSLNKKKDNKPKFLLPAEGKPTDTKKNVKERNNFCQWFFKCWFVRVRKYIFNIFDFSFFVWTEKMLKAKIKISNLLNLIWFQHFLAHNNVGSRRLYNSREDWCCHNNRRNVFRRTKRPAEVRGKESNQGIFPAKKQQQGLDEKTRSRADGGRSTSAGETGDITSKFSK